MMLEVFRKNWKSYLGIHLAVNILSLVVLTPLTTLLIGWLIRISGQAALTDEDILFFALTPKGSVVLLLIAAIIVTTTIFEQAAMLLANLDKEAKTKANLLRVIRSMPGIFLPLFRLALQMIIRTVLLMAPFVAIIAVIFHSYLGEYDINYYLSVKPPEFWWAGGFGLLCVLAMTFLLLRVFSGWILALPLLVLNRETPDAALKKSRQSSAGSHISVTAILLGILLFNTAALMFVSWLTGISVDAAVLFSGQSLRTLAFFLGALFIAWVMGNVAVTFLSNTTLNLLILKQFEHVNLSRKEKLSQHPEQASLHQPKWSHAWSLWIGLAVLSSLVAGLVITLKSENLAAPDHTRIIAHRGASMHAPENTLAAVEAAIEQGADWVEIDVQETADGQVVVIHDSDLKKIGGSSFKVGETSLANLQQIDVGSWKDPSFSDQRIPSLRQLLELCKGRIKVLIELKYYGHEHQLEERVADIVKATGMQEQIMVMSLNYQGVRKMKSLQPEWQVGLLSSVTIGDLTRLNADFFAINANFASRSLISTAHQRQREVLVWTVNDPLSMSALMSKGVDGIITDNPGLAVTVRQERAEMELVERLLIGVANFLGKPPPRPEQ